MKVPGEDFNFGMGCGIILGILGALITALFNGGRLLP